MRRIGVAQKTGTWGDDLDCALVDFGYELASDSLTPVAGAALLDAY